AFWCAAFSPDGKTLATGHGPGEVRLWSVENGTQSATINNNDGQVLSVAYSRDGRYLAVGGQNRTVKVYDARTRGLVVSFAGHEQHRGQTVGYYDWKWTLRALALSPDGNLVVSGGNDRTVRVWDVANRRHLRTITHSEPVTAVAFHPGGKLVA